jgi:hypothetical protein
MQTFDAWHLPAGSWPSANSLDAHAVSGAAGSGPARSLEYRTEPARFGDAAIRVPLLTADDVRSLAATLLDAGEKLRAHSVDSVIAAVDAVAARFLDDGDPLRAQALEWLPRTTGYSAAMARTVLDRMATDWRAPALRDLLRSELPNPRALDRFVRRRGRYVRAYGPRLAFHVLSGNVPGVGVTSLVRSLLVRAPALCKTARDEPVLPVLFARALHEAHPAIGNALAVTWWPGGDVALEAAALDAADVLIHYGSAAALSSLAARSPAHVRIVDHGPRISFGAVAHDHLHRGDLPAQVARATAMFDQQGCVSPHLVYLEAPHDPAPARDFARRVADAFTQLEPELSRGRITSEEAIAIRQVRESAEFRAISGEDVALWDGPNLSYTVIYDSRPGFVASCLNRTLWCRRIASLELVPDVVKPFAPLLQSVALAAPRGRMTALASRLGAAGVTRVTCFDSLPWPPPTWHHDGRGPLRELLRWVDFEPS